MGVNLQTVVSIQNHWREYYNPLPALDLQRARSLYDFARRGLNAELQNVYREMEMLFPTLIALKARRTSELLRREFTVTALDDDQLPPGATPTMADEQAACLKEAYAAIKNKRRAIKSLTGGFFRGWAHLEKIYAHPGTSDFTVSELSFVEQWHWTRKSMYAQWEYVAAATQTNIGLPIDFDQWVIFEADFPLNRLALTLWIRANLCEKDWDAFVEIYGIPHWIVIMPPNVPKEKEAEYMGAARTIASGGSGALPNGSDAKSAAASAKSAGDPFRPRLDWIQEQLVLAGTGGLLTMLTAPTGIGKGPTDEHADAFDKVGDMDAFEISEVMQQQFEVPILAREFPDQPILARGNLAPPQETDVTSACAQILQLSQAGYQVSPEQVTLTTKYQVTIKATPAPDDSDDDEDEPLTNRQPSAALEDNAAAPIADETRANLGHAADKLSSILQISDDSLRETKLKELLTQWPGITADTLLAVKTDALENTIGAALADGVSTPKTK